MEEARSLEPRRVVIEFSPQRLADAILALAFERVMASSEANGTCEHSVQKEEGTDCVEVSLCEETWQ